MINILASIAFKALESALTTIEPEVEKLLLEQLQKATKTINNFISSKFPEEASHEEIHSESDQTQG